MSTPAGDNLVGDATIRVDGDTDPAMRALRQFSRDADGRLRDLRGRFVSESALINRSLTQAAGGGDRFGGSLRSLTNVARSIGPVLGRVGVGLGALGASAGTAAPLLAGIVTTLESIAPAGAVAVTGMLAVQQASAVVKLGMVGISDAATAAFDTSAAGAEKFNEAIEKLAPNARAFAVALRDAQPAFERLQQGVQNRLFTGLADELGRLAAQVLPVVRTNLNATALTLNRMALGASSAARELATEGTLGRAMAGANQGLSNLRTVPGQVVTALGQLAAAGAPAFDRITAAAAGAATSISERLGAAFESGALEDAVNTAIDVLRDLGQVAGNVFAILGNVMAPLQQAGGGLIGVLVEITGALREATATQGFQDAIGALAGVMGTLARTVGPLLGQALAAIGPVFTALGPPVERLIANLGDALSPVIAALGPVLDAAATAVGALLDALSPLLPVIGNLIAGLLPVLTPLFAALQQIFQALAPSISIIAEILGQTLSPILQALPVLLQPLLDAFVQLAERQGPLLADLLTQLQPSLVKLSVAFGQILEAIAPLLPQLLLLSTQLFEAIAPFLPGLIESFAQLAAIFTDDLVAVINGLVVPALRLLADLLSGDTPSAAKTAGTALKGLKTIMNQVWAAIVTTVRQKINEVVTSIRGLPGRAAQAITPLIGSLRSRASEAGSQLVSAIRQKISDAVSAVRGLPGRASAVLSNLGSRLVSSGRALIQGFIDGIRDKAGAVASAVTDVVSAARDLLPFSPAKEGPFSGRGYSLFSGRAISESLAEGIAQRERMVQQAAASVARSAHNALSMQMTPTLTAAPSQLGVGALRPQPRTTVVINNTLQLTNDGVIGSPFELQNWLARALDQAARTGRLPAALRTA